jgi:small multidrug resistance family-3 protein
LALRSLDPATDTSISATEHGTMPTALQGVPALVLLLIATVLETSGDAVVRMAIYGHSGLIRLALFVCGAALLFGYGSFLNLAPLEFGRVVGLYIATLFVVWQVINFVFFRSLPTMPIVLGGTLVIIGGAVITFWKPT